MIRIRKADEKDTKRVDAFYANMGRRATASESQVVLIAEDADKIVGAVRLCVENGHQILRTMMIQEEYRRKGIGKQMLVALEEYMKDGDCYCLPYAHLIHFYGSVGFVQITERETPDHLQERYQRYMARGEKFVIMKRSRGYEGRS